jgi:hypothetical protein
MNTNKQIYDQMNKILDSVIFKESLDTITKQLKELEKIIREDQRELTLRSVSPLEQQRIAQSQVIDSIVTDLNSNKIAQARTIKQRRERR